MSTCTEVGRTRKVVEEGAAVGSLLLVLRAGSMRPAPFMMAWWMMGTQQTQQRKLNAGKSGQILACVGKFGLYGRGIRMTCASVRSA